MSDNGKFGPGAADAVHTWEDSKENFQPKKDGRKADTLVRAALQQHGAPLADKAIERERR